jgi:protoheme ferro-lyase
LNAAAIAANRSVDHLDPAPLPRSDAFDPAARFPTVSPQPNETPVPTSLGRGVSVVEGPAAVTTNTASSGRKVGVLLTSHGDIDNVDTELREYVREAVLRNPGLPLPSSVRPFVDTVGWPLQKGNLLSQYAATGPTRYAENSQKQAQAVTDALRAKGVDAKAYVGFNFMAPNIDAAVEKMKADGITDIVVFNQGAQNSVATMGESVHEVDAALKARPGYKPEVKAVLEFGHDKRFEDLLVSRLVEDAQRLFPGSKPEETLIFLTSHGLPKRLIDQGDTATRDMMDLYGRVKTRLEASGYQVTHGYLNDDFFPGAEWTSPKAIEVAKTLVEDVTLGKRQAPKNVLLDGRLSFTVHHRATLFDADTEVREVLTTPRGPAWSRFKGADVKLAPNFDGDAGFANLVADLTVESLAGKAKNVALVRDPNGDGR